MIIKNFSTFISNEIVSFKLKAQSHEDIPCHHLTFLACFLIIVFILGILSNSALLWIYYEKKEFRKPLDLLIITLTLNNFIGTLIELPPLILTNSYCK
jgi:hypothetical protein